MSKSFFALIKLQNQNLNIEKVDRRAKERCGNHTAYVSRVYQETNQWLFYDSNTLSRNDKIMTLMMILLKQILILF